MELLAALLEGALVVAEPVAALGGVGAEVRLNVDIIASGGTYPLDCPLCAGRYL
jgi:hypothetical protein